MKNATIKARKKFYDIHEKMSIKKYQTYKTTLDRALYLISCKLVSLIGIDKKKGG